MKEPLYILDGYAIIFRSYYAFINRPLKNSDGKNISAIFGFYRTLFNIFKMYRPTNFVVALDSKGPTFRNEIFPDYKANRSAAPEDLIEQFPVIINILEELEIPSIAVPGYEADDIIGTLVTKCEEEGRESFIISGDKDLMQLLSNKTSMLRPDGKGGFSLYTPETVLNEKLVRPDQIIDFLSLMGDTADNIPGVKGIGEKTASKLLEQFGTLEGIYENIDSIKAKGEKTKLIAGKESAFLSKDLVKLDTNCPINKMPEECILKEIDRVKSGELFAAQGINAVAPSDDNSTAPVKKVEARKGIYKTILTENDLNRVVEESIEKGLIAFDCETDSIDAMIANPVGFSISYNEFEAYYIPLKAAGCQSLPASIVKSALEKIFSKCRIIGQNIKYDYKVLKRWGVEIEHIVFDTMIAAWILDSSLRSFSMDFLAENYLNYKTIPYDEVVPKNSVFSDVEIDKATEYAAEDADITFRLYLYFVKIIDKEESLKKIFYDMEIPLIKILAKMEMFGVHLNGAELDDFSTELSNTITETEKEIFSICGKEFNISSTKQLQEVLFQDRGLTPGKKTKTGYSTDTAVLELLAKEDIVAEKIIEYRVLTKLKSTYADALPKLINPVTGRVHTHFLQTGTATGRLSSKDPNLQNIPVKDDRGRRIRRAFVPSMGKIFLSADYSQIELVVLAHLSRDPGLVDAYNHGRDIHSQTAAIINQVELDDVTPAMRRVAKTINFGVMYGMSAFRLSNELDIPRKDAADFINRYFTEFAGIKTFMDETLLQAEELGAVTTILGRKRVLPGIQSSNKLIKAGAQRAAINSVVQGSAADIMKKAMLEIDRRIGSECPNSKMVLQVHDEFIFETDEIEKSTLEKLVKESMEGAIKLIVPLTSSIEYGNNWGDIH
ncbi:MAG: DNA polymerase I [Spirochaetales bacterium]|nr:DNA polymerase I [Spirochaetales bacterium]